MDEKELYEELKDKVNKLEDTEIKKIKEDISQIKIDLNTNNILTKQSIETSKQLSEAMSSFKETMIEMGQSLKDGNRISSELAETVKNLNDKVDNAINKIEAILIAEKCSVSRIEDLELDNVEELIHEYLMK